MKGIFRLLALATILFSAQLFAHHAAEGIISDELWNEIDDNLEATSSPHLDLDFDDPGCLNNLYDCMETDLETVDDDLFMVTTVDVYFLTEEDQLDPDTAIETYFDDAYDNSLDAMNSIPSGTLNEDTASVFYVHVTNVDVDDDGLYDYAVIDLYEPIGNGRSQIDTATNAPASPPNMQK
jgi:hypothetical protein